MSRELVLFKQEHIGLAWDFHVNPSSCSNHEHFEDYVKFHAISDNACGRGTTYALIETTGVKEQMLGFVTLRASSLTMQVDDHIEGTPALEISELAVGKEFERTGVGSDLVYWAISKALELNENHLAIMYIVICADALAVDFYKRFDFSEASDSYDVPREGWNSDCVPLLLNIHNTSE